MGITKSVLERDRKRDRSKRRDHDGLTEGEREKRSDKERHFQK